MRRVVIDASAFLGWFTSDGPGRRLRDEYERGLVTVIAPRNFALGVLEAAAAEVERLAAAPTVEGVRIDLRRIAGHPPMERTDASGRLVDLAVSIAAELGVALRDAATGGASDANTTAALGVPTIDGLGPVGGDDHSVDEWLDLTSVVPRTTLLAGLIDRIRHAA